MKYFKDITDWEELKNTVVCGDCLEGMKKIPDNSVDLIITSPPYEDISGAGYGGQSKDILFLKLYSDFIDKVFSEYYRIIKDTGQIFFNIKHKTHKGSLSTVHWLEFLESFQKFKLKSYIIWKYAGSFDSTKIRFPLDYEIIYHLSKGDNININENPTSVWYVPHNISQTDRKHPTQMPVQLADKIIKAVKKEGDLVLDNFSGVWTTALSAKQNGLDFIGFELQEKYCRIGEKRLEQEVLF